jgi:ABC-type oligopeptide transport system ATPase subunit
MSAADEALLRVRGLQTWYPIRGGLLRGVAGWVQAATDVSLEVRAGRTLALVGESGCGKSTVGRSILCLEKPQKGEVLFEGHDLLTLPPEELRPDRRGDALLRHR